MGVSNTVYRFGDFVLDTTERQLRRNDRPVKLSARYFDALVLLVRENGRLIGKDQFFAEVWQGVVVGDEALTQAMKTLRSALGDRAGDPRYIETVPKHGYRFIAAVEPVGAKALKRPDPQRARRSSTFAGRIAVGTLGGMAAGAVGGLIYGSAIAFGPGAPEPGAASIFALLMALNLVVGALGAFAVSLGWAAAMALSRERAAWGAAGAALGGTCIGWLTRGLGLDAFSVALGATPRAITGALEGAALGLAIGASLALAARALTGRQAVFGAATICALTGLGITALDGTLMAASLAHLGAAITASPLALTWLRAFIDAMAVPASTIHLLGGLEALVFGVGVVSAITWLRRRGG